ncbi:predicted protein [Botrytis cinerea T4]|uniref:Uncharacterized protein n=1 Tax=Botryotinia fuckeliana (strain T4) TaxID=999810 RepID=G2Y257_BOTF4|nr:predicted protein [Botrytis cinerea T4]
MHFLRLFKSTPKPEIGTFQAKDCSKYLVVSEPQPN